MHTNTSEVRTKRRDPAELFAAIKREFDAVDLDAPLPSRLREAIAIGRCNRYGIEPDENALRLLLLAHHHVISYDEFTPLLMYLTEREGNG